MLGFNIYKALLCTLNKGPTLSRWPIITSTFCTTTAPPPPKDENKPQHTLRYSKPKLKFVVQGIDLNKYTHKPLKYPKTGGRSAETGRVFNRRYGGGCKQSYRMLDYTRFNNEDGTPKEEKVIRIQYDPLRSADIALVGEGTLKRWIIAGEKMQVGDIIKNYGDIPEIPINPRVGDSHPVGALPVGTLLHNIEETPNIGGGLVRAAGSFASIQRRLEDGIVIRLPSGQEAKLDFRCRATIGRVCLPERHLLPIGSAKRSRWFGIRPRSGLYHKKTGYHGRKINPPKPMVTYEKRTKDRVFEMFDI